MKVKNKKLDLQMFADDGINPDSNDDTEKTDTKGKGSDKQKDIKTFTQEELDNIIKERLARERKQQEVELRRTIEREREEAKRLAELSAEERERELAEKTKEELEQTKAELRRIRLEQDAIDRLNEDGLDISFKDFLIGEDEESTNENIKSFKKVFDKAVQDAVEDKLKGKTPTNSSTQLNKDNPDLSINKLAEQARII